MRWDIAYYSDKGSRRINEDRAAVFQKEKSMLAVLADGLGGHGHGDIASQTVVRTAERFFEKEEWSEDYLPGLFTACNEELLRMQEASVHQEAMKTTLVALYCNENMARWCHCGDSRAYLFQRGRKTVRTLDHSVPQTLALAGDIKEKEIRNHPDRNRLLYCLGIPWDKRVFDLGNEFALKGEEMLLLCSDGFWELVQDREMGFAQLFSKNAEEALERLRIKAAKRGAGRKMDNNSAIVIMAHGGRK